VLLDGALAAGSIQPGRRRLDDVGRLGAVACAELLLDELGELAVDGLADELLELGAARGDELSDSLVDRASVHKPSLRRI
jgi:hypothetical protein